MENSERWTNTKVQALLKFYAMEEIQCGFEGSFLSLFDM